MPPGMIRFVAPEPLRVLEPSILESALPTPALAELGVLPSSALPSLMQPMAVPPTITAYFGNQPYPLHRLPASADELGESPKNAAHVTGATLRPDRYVDVFLQDDVTSFGLTLAPEEAEALGFTTNGRLNGIDAYSGLRVYASPAQASVEPHALDPTGLPVILKPLGKHRNPYDPAWELKSVAYDPSDPARPYVVSMITSQDVVQNYARTLEGLPAEIEPQIFRLDPQSFEAFQLPLKPDPKRTPQYTLRYDTSKFPVGVNRYVDEGKRIEGAPWHRVVQTTDGISVACFRGFYAEAKAQEDRPVIGDNYFAVLDGLGGEGGGEFAAETVRLALIAAMKEGHNLKDAVTIAEKAFHQEKVREFAGSAGTTFVGFERTAPDEIAVHKNGDSELVLFGFDEGDPSSLSVDFWTDTPMLPTPDKTLPDGRARAEIIPSISLNPGSAQVIDYIGKSPRAETPLQSWNVTLMPDRKYMAFLMSDGLREQFRSYDEMRDLVRDSGATTMAEAQDVLLRTGLIRSKLAALQLQNPKLPLKVTPDVLKEAHRAMTRELYRREYEPSPEFLNVGPEMYVVNYHGAQYIAAPEAIDWKQGTLKMDPRDADPSLVYARVKVDNITLVGVDLAE